MNFEWLITRHEATSPVRYHTMKSNIAILHRLGVRDNDVTWELTYYIGIVEYVKIIPDYPDFLNVLSEANRLLDAGFMSPVSFYDFYREQAS